MKQLLYIFLISIPSLCFSQNLNYPLIPKYGGIYEIPDAVNIIDTAMTYKIVVDVTDAVTNLKTEINPAYLKVARLMNLHGGAGVKAANLDIVCVIHSNATTSVLSDEGFMTQFGNVNPNTEIISLLADKGVRFYVCGQSLIARKLTGLPINPIIKPILGALIGLSHFQNSGYALFN